MDIHILLKKYFDKNEKWESLPKQVKLSYIEIELHEKKKQELKKNELNHKNNNLTFSPIDKKNEIKKDFEKLNIPIINNKYSYFLCITSMNKWTIDNNIKTINLYNNFNDNNIFSFLFNYVKNQTTYDYNLMTLFRNYILNNDKQIINYIFLDNKNKIFSCNLLKSNIYGNHIIKINNDYYRLTTNDYLNRHNNYVMDVFKLKPKFYDDVILYHFSEYENNKITISLSNEQNKPDNEKIIHIRLEQDFYYIQNKI